MAPGSHPKQPFPRATAAWPGTGAMSAPRRHPIGRMTVIRRYESHPDAVPAARRLTRRLRAVVDSEVVERVELAISELVTNAVRHAPPDGVTVRLSTSMDAVRVEVTDRGGGEVTMRSRSTKPDGHGLALVDAIADQWGVVRDTATTVWVEIALARGGGAF